ncbi:MAG: methyltransferase domain-containing protein [Bacteroidales bacterium]|nr:methyltransferase domain-containing protein [Bacteroidales bacterium]
MRTKKNKSLTLTEISYELNNGNIAILENISIEDEEGLKISELIQRDYSIYEQLILGSLNGSKRYDWNLGFLLRGLDVEILISVLENHQEKLAKLESLSWALGELGIDDERIIVFLLNTCKFCYNYDAWWCAAEALEKLKHGDAVDIKKRTLKDENWQELEFCFENLSERASVIGILKHARLDNTEDIIVPRCREKLESENKYEVQNAVWLLERLRIDDDETIESLFKLYEKAEDKSNTLKPRIVEAFGRIASPETREVLEDALLNAKYYRTRAYAAMGLGKIGNIKSEDILKKALKVEKDNNVVGFISNALYEIKDKTKNNLNELSRSHRWPENGMIYDNSDSWYSNTEIYEGFSNAEDPLNVSFEYAISNIHNAPEKVIDLGCGTGRFAMFLAQEISNVKEIYAIDSNKAMVEHLGRKLRKNRRFSKKIFPKLANIQDLPFEDASIDCIVSSWAFPSKIWDLKLCLTQLMEVYRVLKPGGQLITLGWDESFRDELSKLWYHYVPEPDYFRESFESWRKRRIAKIKSPRNCHLTFVKKNVQVPLLFTNPEDAAYILGFLFGFTAGEDISKQSRREFSINVGITNDSKEDLFNSIEKLNRDIAEIKPA